MQSRIVIHRAPWVLPISCPAVENGAVALESGRIAGVGRFDDIRNEFPSAAIIDHPQSVILPALVNAHTHLELSSLAHISQQPPPDSFTGWIEHMLAERLKTGLTGEDVNAAARAALDSQQRDGVVAIGDISNTGLTRELVQTFSGELLSFKEYLGSRSSGVEASLQALTEEGELFCTAHAPYSTHADLLVALKQRANRYGHVFPLHVAETAAESEMMSRGRGELPDFLERRGFWDGSFQATGIDNSGSVQYLHQLGVLDDKTLCVHCIHISDEEINLLRQSGARVCLCPGSNRYLDVGRAPLARYLANDILPALGTDSLASNPEVSIWREMRLLSEDHPEVSPAVILAAATLGGARGLGLDSRFGTLEVGKEAALLCVRLRGVPKRGDEVAEMLVGHGSRPSVERLNGTENHVG